jgi:hypothetical protein
LQAMAWPGESRCGKPRPDKAKPEHYSQPY